MDFWKMAYEYGWASLEDLKIVVITDENPFGYITKEEYKVITGQEYKE